MKNSENQLETSVMIPRVSRTETSNWHETDWNHANREVFNLQRRIAKAEREGRRGKVKRLQNLLTHSTAAKKLAVRRVTKPRSPKPRGRRGNLEHSDGKSSSGRNVEGGRIQA